MSIAPLAPERYRIQLTVSRETHDKFRHAQALLRHALPSGDAAEIFDRAVSLLVDQLERQRFARTERPRVTNSSLRPSRHISAKVRRAVWRRDGGRCAFVGTEGRCAERAFLEFHHVEPHAVGGAATVENLELRCRAHNAYESRLFFGPDVVREERSSWGRLVPERAAWYFRESASEGSAGTKSRQFVARSTECDASVLWSDDETLGEWPRVQVRGRTRRIPRTDDVEVTLPQSPYDRCREASCR